MGYMVKTRDGSIAYGVRVTSAVADGVTKQLRSMQQIIQDLIKASPDLGFTTNINRSLDLTGRTLRMFLELGPMKWTFDQFLRIYATILQQLTNLFQMMLPVITTPFQVAFQAMMAATVMMVQLLNQQFEFIDNAIVTPIADMGLQATAQSVMVARQGYMFGHDMTIRSWVMADSVFQVEKMIMFFVALGRAVDGMFGGMMEGRLIQPGMNVCRTADKEFLEGRVFGHLEWTLGDFQRVKSNFNK